MFSIFARPSCALSADFDLMDLGGRSSGVVVIPAVVVEAADSVVAVAVSMHVVGEQF